MSLVKFDPTLLGDRLHSRMLEQTSQAKAQLQKIQDQDLEYGFLDWFNYPNRQGFAELDAINQYKDNLAVDYDCVVVIGIGGSYMGSCAIAEALGQSGNNGKLPLFFAGHHLSEADHITLLESLDNRLPLVNVISKSGTTTEPAIAFRIIRHYMTERFGAKEANLRTVVTTDGNSGALRQLAMAENLQKFEIPPQVGGRFSVLSPVGLLPLTLAGYKTRDLLDGAHEVFSEAKDSLKDDDQVPGCLLYAAARHVAYEDGKKIELLAYNQPRLQYLVEWWKQLFGESDTKGGRGIFPSGFSYTTDLHSLGQLAQEGERNLLETFLSFDKMPLRSDGVEQKLKIPSLSDNTDQLGYLEGMTLDQINETAMKATKMAHHDGGVPCLEIKLPVLSEHSLGGLIAFFETACAVGGLLAGINPFNQPGVEAYKQNLFGLLGKPGYESLGAELRQRLLT